MSQSLLKLYIRATEEEKKSSRLNASNLMLNF